ncbi:MAG: helix-turn-helix transcriptional regulator [Lachnospiraceae bacterium]|nr:helix-turn-helix transcriptional regulator [Lachnospiraceae bacterium]
MEFQYKEMGTRIKVRRRELKIKQAELAEKLEISNNHMSSIENGRQKPSLDTFIGICKCLNVTPDYLLLGTMHAYNIPQDILDKLRLCNQSDIELARDFIELLVKRNSIGNAQNDYMFP